MLSLILSLRPWLLAFCLFISSAQLLLALHVESADPSSASCSGRWVVQDLRLKDHAFFEHDGWWYFVSTSAEIDTSDPYGEHHFAYARSQDFCSWEMLGSILAPGAAGSPDEQYLWAPHVIEEAGIYYLFYTGVNKQIAQSIMLATSTTPENPLSWQKRGVLFRPDHPGAIYPGPDQWSDARDPMIRKWQGNYYLYYSGLDEAGGIIGVAMANNPAGPYKDLGAIQTGALDARLESPYVLDYDGGYYLYYNTFQDGRGRGTVWHWGPSPFGPWQAPNQEPLGWAHDFALVDGVWMSSFLGAPKDGVIVAPVTWKGSNPAAPIVGERLFLPLVGSLR